MDQPQRPPTDNANRFSRTIGDPIHRVHYTGNGFGKSGNFTRNILWYRVNTFFAGGAVLGKATVTQHSVSGQIIAEAGLMVPTPVALAATLVGITNYPLPDFQILYFLAHFDDFTGVLMPRHHGDPCAVLTCVQLQVGSTHAAGLDLDHYLVGLGLRDRNFLDRNLLNIFEHGGFHCSAPAGLCVAALINEYHRRTVLPARADSSAAKINRVLSSPSSPLVSGFFPSRMHSTK